MPIWDLLHADSNKHLTFSKYFQATMECKLLYSMTKTQTASETINITPICGTWFEAEFKDVLWFQTNMTIWRKALWKHNIHISEWRRL